MYFSFRPWLLEKWGHCWFLDFPRCLRELIVEIVEDDRKTPVRRERVRLTVIAIHRRTMEYATTIRD